MEWVVRGDGRRIHTGVWVALASRSEIWIWYRQYFRESGRQPARHKTGLDIALLRVSPLEPTMRKFLDKRKSQDSDLADLPQQRSTSHGEQPAFNFRDMASAIDPQSPTRDHTFSVPSPSGPRSPARGSFWPTPFAYSVPESQVRMHNQTIERTPTAISPFPLTNPRHPRTPSTSSRYPMSSTSHGWSSVAKSEYGDSHAIDTRVRHLQHDPRRSSKSGPSRIARRIHEPCAYTLTQIASNSLILRSSDDDSTPLYLITLTMNHFCPASWITTIYRGSPEDGEYVGEFEAGTLGCTKPSTVSIRGAEYFMKDVFEFSTRSGCFWKLPGNTLCWDASGNPRSCFDSNPTARKGELLAKFAPTGLSPPEESVSQPLPTLIIYPAGQNRFDDILLSALILERKRTTMGGQA